MRKRGIPGILNELVKNLINIFIVSKIKLKESNYDLFKQMRKIGLLKRHQVVSAILYFTHLIHNLCNRSSEMSHHFHC